MYPDASRGADDDVGRHAKVEFPGAMEENLLESEKIFLVETIERRCCLLAAVSA